MASCTAGFEFVALGLALEQNVAVGSGELEAEALELALVAVLEPELEPEPGSNYYWVEAAVAVADIVDSRFAASSIVAVVESAMGVMEL